MSRPMDSLHDSWRQLAPRDQRILLLAAPLVVLLVLYLLVLAPLQERHHAAAALLEQRKLDYLWLKQQPPAIASASSCQPDQAAQAGMGEVYWQQRAASLGIQQFTVAQVGGGEWEMKISRAPAQAVLRLVDELVCQGFNPLAINMAVAEGDLVDVELNLLVPTGVAPNAAARVQHRMLPAAGLGAAA